jgi:hypothetical protein
MAIALYPQEDPWYSFLLEAESTPGPIVRLEGLGQLKKSSDLIGISTPDLRACSTVPQPATLPRTHLQDTTHENIETFSRAIRKVWIFLEFVINVNFWNEMGFIAR